MNETIYILLPVHNRRDITKRFVDCLKVQTYSRFHLVLIDDGSEDGTAEMVHELIPSATTLRGIGDWWWAGSLQRGYDWLRQQNVPQRSIVLIINDDTVIEPDFFEKAVQLLAGREKMLLLAQYYSLQDGRLIDSGLHIDWKTYSYQQTTSSEQLNCLSTRGLFLRYSDFREIGGFFTKLLPHYYSDYEFTIRAHRKGFRLCSNSSLKLFGDETTTGTHFVESESTLRTLKKLFSIKTIPNPAVISVYIILACPYRWIFINLLRIWHNAFTLVGKALLRDCHRIFSLDLKS